MENSHRHLIPQDVRTCLHNTLQADVGEIDVGDQTENLFDGPLFVSTYEDRVPGIMVSFSGT